MKGIGLYGVTEVKLFFYRTIGISESYKKKNIESIKTQTKELAKKKNEIPEFTYAIVTGQIEKYVGEKLYMRFKSESNTIIMQLFWYCLVLALTMTLLVGMVITSPMYSIAYILIICIFLYSIYRIVSIKKIPAYKKRETLYKEMEMQFIDNITKFYEHNRDYE